MNGIRTILHPTDFSENARYAFQTACAMAREKQATLVMLHVMMPSLSPLFQPPPHNPLQSAESQEPHAHYPWLRPSDPQVRVEHRLAEGEPAEEILRLAGLVPCDLIVMGTHGRTGVARFVTGSVAEEVLRRATCPVLLVKIPLRPAPEPEIEVTASPGEVVDVRPRATGFTSARTRTLVHTTTTEVVRLIVRAGQEITGQTSKGETIVQCLEGRVSLTALGKTQPLEAGRLLHFPVDQPYAFHGIEDASLLVTTVVPGLRHA